jgi:alpha-glucosidase (family GH31 glycosyl hydrolase)
MRLLLLFYSFFVLTNSLCCQSNYSYCYSIPMLPGEHWWGGAVNEGDKMPFLSGYTLDLYANNVGNQATPCLVSSSGRYVWSDEPFQFSIQDNLLTVKSVEKIQVERGESNLANAFLLVSKKHFPATGKLPDTLLISRPQYNTWIELTYNQNQQDILTYAHAILDHGFPAGVLMIDDNWAPYYGRFEFRKDRFPDAKRMMDELHALGFKVMVWVSPFIRPDSEEFRELFNAKSVLLDNKGDTSLTWSTASEAALIHWWNGYSAELDFTNPDAVKWFTAQLQKMHTDDGVDGFKFDAGDMEFYPETAISFKKVTANSQCELWGQFGLLYPLNEYRAMWKHGGQPLAERLRDKQHSWKDLQTLVPDLIASGLLGYAFTCPDMIGGGEFSSFIGKTKLDQDLVVRSAQCHALMPMMQFSVAPWRILDNVHFKAVKKAVALRQLLTPYILSLAKEAAYTGEPIVRSLEYVFPHKGLDTIKDEFMLGNKYLVAPVVQKENRRVVVFPPGKWRNESGTLIAGPGRKEYIVPIEQLLYFERSGI